MMSRTIIVTAKPASYENSIEKIDDTHFQISIKEPPIRGRANAAIITLLAEYFHVSRAKITIIRGHASRQKIIVIGK